jgi:hypothetical protein
MRLLSRLSIPVFTQHPTSNKKVHFGGNLFDGFTPLAKTSIPPVRSVLLATPERLFAQLSASIPSMTEIEFEAEAPVASQMRLEEKIASVDAVITSADPGVIVTAMELGKFPLVLRQQEGDISTFLQAKGLCLSVAAEEMTWNDVSVAASWEMDQAPVPPFVLDD